MYTDSTFSTFNSLKKKNPFSYLEEDINYDISINIKNDFIVYKLFGYIKDKAGIYKNNICIDLVKYSMSTKDKYTILKTTYSDINGFYEFIIESDMIEYPFKIIVKNIK